VLIRGNQAQAARHGTDKEIDAAEYGAAPPGYDFLVIGHEGFGQVEAVGPNVTELKPGDYVVATVRRARAFTTLSAGSSPVHRSPRSTGFANTR
jgi:threonine dehydrogenase-like Zn-dependent dehydrogenase